MGDLLGFQSSLEPVTVLLIFLIIVINQIFLVSLTTVLLKKVKLIIKSTARKYYAFVLFYIVSKMILCVVLEVKIIQGIPNNFADLDGQNIEKLFKNSLVFADCAIVELFLIAFEHYLALSFSIFGNFHVEKTVRLLMQGVQLVTFLTLMIPLLIFNVNGITYETLNVFICGLNCFSVIAFIAGFFFMNFKMTGIMMNRRSSEIVKKVYTLLLVTLLSRTIMAAVEIWIEINLKNGSFSDFISILEQNQDKFVVLGFCFILYLLIILLTEGLPLMLSLRETLIMAMTETNTSLRTSSSIITQNQIREELLNNLDGEDEPENSQPMSREQHTIEAVKDLNIVQKLKSTEDYSTYKTTGKENNQTYFLRELSNISNYIFEEISQELEIVMKSNAVCVNSTKIFLDQETEKIYILESYCEENLQRKLQKIISTESLKKRVELSLDIAKAIQQFQQCFKSGHGVLNPYNILFDKENKIKLTGFGMESLKKYLSLTADYTNITLYTDIDLMGNLRQKTIYKPKKSSDIYSFGIIFYEIVTGNFKYRELSITEVKEKFKKDNFRPKIIDTIEEPLKKIMRKCWQEQPENRPDINWIVNQLDQIKNQF